MIVYHTWNDLKSLRLFPGRLRDLVFAAIADNKPVWEKIARHSQIAIRLRNFLLDLAMTKRENYYTSLEREGGTASEPVADEAIEWLRRNFEDIAQLVSREDALPIFVTQATLAHPQSIRDPAIRIAIENDYVGMTLPILVETWQRANSELIAVASKYNSILVDGYERIPPSFKFLEDHVHLTDEGDALLAKTIVETLESDVRFIQRLKQAKRLDSAAGQEVGK